MTSKPHLSVHWPVISKQIEFGLWRGRTLRGISCLGFVRKVVTVLFTRSLWQPIRCSVHVFSKRVLSLQRLLQIQIQQATETGRSNCYRSNCKVSPCCFHESLNSWTDCWNEHGRGWVKKFKLCNCRSRFRRLGECHECSEAALLWSDCPFLHWRPSSGLSDPRRCKVWWRPSSSSAPMPRWGSAATGRTARACTETGVTRAGCKSSIPWMLLRGQSI